MDKPTGINQVINNLQSNPLPSDQPTAQAEWTPTSQHLERMNRLWGQLVRLYRHKWTSSEGLSEVDGIPTENFLMWAYEFRMTTNDSLLKGLDAAKTKVRESTDENWPPTLEEFKGLCAKSKLSPGAGANPDAYRVVPRLGIEDKTKQEKQNEKNKAHIARMRESLNSGGDVRA